MVHLDARTGGVLPVMPPIGVPYAGVVPGDEGAIHRARTASAEARGMLSVLVTPAITKVGAGFIAPSSATQASLWSSPSLTGVVSPQGRGAREAKT